MAERAQHVTDRVCSERPSGIGTHTEVENSCGLHVLMFV